jgi:hypothetical protein
LDSATTDVNPKNEEVSPVIFSLLPCYAEIGPCYFLRGILLETLMESAFVDDIVVILAQFCDSPLYFALLSRKTRSGDEFGSDCILSHAVGLHAPVLFGTCHHISQGQVLRAQVQLAQTA